MSCDVGATLASCEAHGKGGQAKRARDEPQSKSGQQVAPAEFHDDAHGREQKYGDDDLGGVESDLCDGGVHVAALERPPTKGILLTAIGHSDGLLRADSRGIEGSTWVERIREIAIRWCDHSRNKSNLICFQRFRNEQLLRREQALRKSLLVGVAKKRSKSVRVWLKAIGPEIFSHQLACVFRVSDEPGQHEFQGRGLEKVLIRLLLCLKKCFV